LIETFFVENELTHFLRRFMRHRNQSDSDPVVRELESLFVENLLSVIDVGQDVQVGRVPGQEMPPAVELGEGAQHGGSENAKPLERVAKFVVQNPKEETEKVPENY
jgi:hypothetical protein